MDWVEETDIQKCLILSDSKSVLQALGNHNYKKADHRILKIKRKLVKLFNKGLIIRFVWVKGHTGVEGNEIVDTIAKESINLAVTYPITDKNDIIREFKGKIRKDWELVWADYVMSTKNPYGLVHPTLPKNIPYIDNYPVKKSYSSIMARLKLNHGAFPAHLCRIGVQNTSACPCDNISYGDLNHIFFSCKKYIKQSEELLSDLINLKVELPINLVSLLSQNKKEIFDLIINFIRTNIIHI